MRQPRPLFRLFLVFSNKQYIFTTNQCEQFPSSIQNWGSNPWPLEHELSPITTTPGLPPTIWCFIISRKHFGINAFEWIFPHLCSWSQQVVQIKFSPIFRIPCFLNGPFPASFYLLNFRQFNTVDSKQYSV